MNTHPKQQPNEQADGSSGGEPLRNDARAYLNEALQLIEFQRGRLQMCLGAEGAKALESSVVAAKRELDTERTARRDVMTMALRQTVAPDPAHLAALAQMEQTNRELGLAGDALAAHLETESGQ